MTSITRHHLERDEGIVYAARDCRVSRDALGAKVELTGEFSTSALRRMVERPVSHPAPDSRPGIRSFPFPPEPRDATILSAANPNQD